MSLPTLEFAGAILSFTISSGDSSVVLEQDASQNSQSTTAAVMCRGSEILWEI